MGFWGFPDDYEPSREDRWLLVELRLTQFALILFFLLTTVASLVMR